MTELRELGWETARIDEALVALATAARLPCAPAPRATGVEMDLARAARRYGLEAEPVDASLQDLPGLVAGGSPALILIDADKDPYVLALARGGKRRVALVSPDRTHHVPAERLVAALGAPIEALVAQSVDTLLERAAIDPSRRAQARAALMRERTGGRRVGGVWLIRLPPTAPFLAQLRSNGVTRRVGLLLLTHLAQYVIAMIAWWTIGSAALQGRVDTGWLLAWALLSLTLVPLHLVELMLQGRVAIDGASLLKRRLLVGALQLLPEEMRGEGAGQLLGRTLEASAVESLALSRGVTSVMAAVDLVVAATILGFGASPSLELIALFGWLLVTAWLVRRYARARQRWTDDRLDLTHDLVERMVGHRTRIAQQPSEHWYDGDDHDLAAYYGGSRRLDRSSVMLTTLVPTVWMLIGLAALAPAITFGATAPASLAVSIGGVLLAYRALRQVAFGSRDIVTVMVAWRRVKVLFESGGREEPVPATVPLATQPAKARDPGHPVLSAQGIVFRYRAGGEPVLRGCDLRIGAGDRVILEGPSGGGKSTLALVLAGIRTPESGTMLVDGLDRHTTGLAEWRRRIVTVPQFHENHVVSATFAFNLLMARGWPPGLGDLRRAEEICRELGLGDLIDRMPAGLQQMVGETGWQLSHGERSRLYIARALLQLNDRDRSLPSDARPNAPLGGAAASPELIVLDESFAALDPETMQRALACVIRRAPALVVVAHP